MVIYMRKHKFLTMDFTSVKSYILCFPRLIQVGTSVFCHGHNSVYPYKCHHLDIIKHK